MARQEPPITQQMRHRDPSDGLWKYLLAGVIVVILLVGGAGVWAATTSISGAVIAQGVVVVESNVKKVQHPTGGVVGRIMVKEGDHVSAGDLLIRLDDTTTLASLQLIVKQLDKALIREARLRAERDGMARIEFPESILKKQKDAQELTEVLNNEKNLFRSRRRAMRGQKAQLRERAKQLEAEIDGLVAQQKAKAQEVVMIKDELVSLRLLSRKNLIPQSRLTAKSREAIRIEGEGARLTASIARARGKIAEIKLQILQLDHDMESQVMKELSDVGGTEAELKEKRIAAQDRLSRIEIRAPRSGIVHQLAVHTVGGVIAAGAQLMLIVPENDKLVIESRIAPQDITNVRTRQHVLVRFTAFNRQTTPEFFGEVSLIGADLTTDPQSRISYYTVEIVLLPKELKRMGNLKLKLVPGMPVEVQLKTSERTVLSYLLRPLRDQIQRVFKHD